MFAHILPVIVNQVFSLHKVRRAPDRQGKLAKISITGSVASIPTMHIRYDGGIRSQASPKLNSFHLDGMNDRQV